MKNFYKRLKSEIKYLKTKNWTLKEVGDFWDSIDDYDEINSKVYPYRERFINSKKLFQDLKLKNFIPKNCLDIQTRTGNGTIFWNEFFPNLNFSIADFSANFLKKSKKNLDEKNIFSNQYLIEKFPLPFDDKKFDLVLCYETIEHISNYKDFFSELERITNNRGIIILTCPNYSWEIVHFIASIFNINHSEGPHTFIKKKYIDEQIKKLNLTELNYNTTIFLPFNFNLSIKIDKILHKLLPNKIKEKIFLRHSYILRKNGF